MVAEDGLDRLLIAIFDEGDTISFYTRVAAGACSFHLYSYNGNEVQSL